MAIDVSFAYRNSVGFASTSPAIASVENACTWERTDGAVHWGWDNESNVQARDRNGGNIHILRGHQRVDGNVIRTFRVEHDDGFAGKDFDVTLAMGDASYAVGGAGMYWRLLDTATVLDTRTGLTTASGNYFRDANGNVHNSDTLWQSNNTPLRISMATDTFYLEIGHASNNTTPVAYMRLVEVVVASTRKRNRIVT